MIWQEKLAKLRNNGLYNVVHSHNTMGLQPLLVKENLAKIIFHEFCLKQQKVENVWVDCTTKTAVLLDINLQGILKGRKTTQETT